MKSFVYFITDDQGRVKIGTSSRPSKRLAEIQVGAGAPLRFLGLIPGDRAEEQLLHAQFAQSRLAGEWFTLTEALREEIDRLIEARGSRTPPQTHRGNGGGEAVCNFLRARYPRKTAECVVADIERETAGLPLKVSLDAVLGLLDKKSRPSFVMMIALIGTYGPEFLAAVYPRRLGWLDPVLRAREIEELRRWHASIQARIEALDAQP